MTPRSTQPPEEAAPPLLRVGLGDDRHRLAPLAPAGDGRPLRLGGVVLESPVGPVSRSDGDALLHALTDAVLGAAGLEDIGQLFPDSDVRNEGRDSADFLREALQRAQARGWRLVCADTVVRLQQPRLSPHKQRIRQRLAELLGLPLDCVNVKGKSGEGVGPVGLGQAVEAQAVVLLTREAHA
ncbi:MAG: 2-C-methyl-D-erythritol 2,4-cyclodiphosphate synthase [Planctomycetota bacterium]|nr:MAG: 2-C-methyl-D-erythritol 2,4-cyclodiphosphate synthase [Planctomycetota bacterium]